MRKKYIESSKWEINDRFENLDLKVRGFAGIFCMAILLLMFLISELGFKFNTEFETCTDVFSCSEIGNVFLAIVLIGGIMFIAWKTGKIIEKRDKILKKYEK